MPYLTGVGSATLVPMGSARTAGERVDGVVAIGASAGGIEALSEVAAGLPADLPFPVLVTLHMASTAPGHLAPIIDRAGRLPAVAASDGALLEPGTIYVAVPDRHLLAVNHRVALSTGPSENHHRPAINALLRSVAVDYGPGAIGVLLSGLLDDGVAGLAAIRARGGTTIAQDPADARFPDLPRNAIDAGVVDHAVSAPELGALLRRLAQRGGNESFVDPDGRIELENRIAMERDFAMALNTEDLGTPTGLTCPVCQGTLMAVADGAYRCPVGHAWTEQALLAGYDETLAETLSAALRTMKEKAAVADRLARRSGSDAQGERYAAMAEEARHIVTVLAANLPPGSVR